jgi:hypothetical protein
VTMSQFLFVLHDEDIRRVCSTCGSRGDGTRNGDEKGKK